jgi:hypothetical protein
MSVSPVMTTADAADPKGKGAKEAKDDTDDYLSALATLREKNKMVAEDARRAIGILEQEEKAYLSSTSSVERKAKAIERLEQLSRIGFMTSLDVVQITQDMNAIRNIEIANAELLAENYEKLGKEARKSADEQIKSAIKLLKIQMHSAQNDEERLALAGRISAMQRVLYENDSFGMGTGGKPTEGKGDDKDKLTMLQRQIRNIKRSLLEAGLGTPGDLISAYFKAMAEQTEEGGSLVAQRMKEALGKIAGSVGQDLIDMGFATLAEEYKDEFKKMIGKMVGAMAGPTAILGKFLTKIKKALMNPLIAGPALILIGAAMMAYSAKMGAAGRGERGGDLAGGIGGLGIGKQDQVQRYSFADRRNPIEGNRVIGMPQQPITVNQTIIGANDPVAQRQIGEMVNQAARRGLVRNG